MPDVRQRPTSLFVTRAAVRSKALPTARPPRFLFRTDTVSCYASPFAWLSLVTFLLLGSLVAVFERPNQGAPPRLLVALQYGLILFLSNAVHTLGHLVAARLLGIRTIAVVVTATFHVNSHLCVHGVCSHWRHIGRALGGPAANLLLGFVALAATSSFPAASVRFLALANLIVAGALVLPIPRVDGWVIWGELLGFRRREPSGPLPPTAA